MVSDGLRLALMLGAPILGATLAHELRRRIAPTLVGCLALALCAGLAFSLVGPVSAGGSVERSFGTAVAGVDLTLRADSASIAAVLLAAVATALALPRLRGGEGVPGILLCLAGTVAVATAANLALAAAGLSLVAAGTLLVLGRTGPGSRAVVLPVSVLGFAALSLLAAAAQLVAGAGSSDTAFVPQGAIGNAVAIPWALGGVALLLSPGIASGSRIPARDWAAAGAVPAGFLVLLRLQQGTGGQPPASTAAALAAGGALAAALAGVVALRSGSLVTTARATTAVVSGILVSLFGGPLSADGVVLAGLLVALELALMAAPAWSTRPGSWSAPALAALALPGGFAVAVAVAGLGILSQRGPGSFPQLLVLAAALVAGAVATARALVSVPQHWSRPAPGAVLAAMAGFAGGLVPGVAVHLVAAPLSGGATPIDLDAGSLAAPGGGFAAGYFAIAAVVVLTAVAAGFAVAGDDEPVRAPGPVLGAVRAPAVRPLLRVRRRTAPLLQASAGAVRGVDRWLEAQPQLPLVVAAAALAVLFLR